jgi:DNA-binding transcriptional regulator LsrR (DeoR family)
MHHTLETDDLVQVAWLYHVGQLSQEDVSGRLGISRFKVLRLLAEARERGLVRFSLEHETTGTLALADQLARKFGLTEVQVAPLPGGVDSDDFARRGVGIVAAAFLARIGRTDGPLTIGVGWGRTVAAMVQALNGLHNRNLRFVSLMGSMIHTSDTSPVDVCTRLANLTCGSAMFLPAPFLCDSEADCQIILQQRLVRETLEAAREARYAIVSVGECTADALVVKSGVLTDVEAKALWSAGAVGDSTGKFFCSDGTLADTDLNRRAPSIGLDDLGRTDVMLLAAGRAKTKAVLAVLRAGFVRRIIVDETLARDVLANA